MLANARLALFLCTLSPWLVWPLSQHRLAHPWQVGLWFVLFATLAASTPAALLRLATLLQVLALPLTLGWIGTVAVTGYGPSNAAFEAATSGAIGELWAATQLALRQADFLVPATLSSLALAWAVRLAWQRAAPMAVPDRRFDLLFLFALVPLAAANLDGAGYPRLAQIAGQEARISVAWHSHIGMAKTWLKEAIDQAGRVADGNQPVRMARQAEKKFAMQPGLAVFVIGESLRADALLQAGRGPWSALLQERLDSGLGVRLRDACAAASSTIGAVPRLLTAADLLDPADPAGSRWASAQSTILASLKVAGAKTAYISNHAHWVVPEAGHDLILRTSTLERETYDDAVIEAFGDFVTRNDSGPLAALLHIYGQHFHYEQRYPHNQFPALPAGLDAQAREELHYARAAEYGASILLHAAAILDRHSTPAFLVFTSDHAENLASDHTGKKYHALPISGKNDTTVPALVLWNRAFANSGKAQLLAPLLPRPLPRPLPRSLPESSPPLPDQGGLIAHRDVALAWLALAGMPGPLQATPNPHTFGAISQGAAFAAIACNTLPP